MLLGQLPSQPSPAPALQGLDPGSPSPCFCPGDLSAELILLVAWMPVGPNHHLEAILAFYFYLCGPSPLPYAASILPSRLWDAQLLPVVSPILAAPEENAEAGAVDRVGGGL